MAPVLIAHWPLHGDARDAAGENHGVAESVSFTGGPDGAPGGAALFSGGASAVRVPDAPPLRLGGGDFTFALWVKCAQPMRSAFGDLLSKFDAALRCGINLTVNSSKPGYTALGDARHVHFGVDDGYVGPWEDCGKPWPSNTLISDLVAFDGSLYAGITDADDPRDAAKVFRWAGGMNWEDCGRLGNDPHHLSAMSMHVHAGKLYAGTGVWDWARAFLGPKRTFDPALSRVFRYEGGASWRDLGQVGTSIRVLSLASFGGALYAGLDRAGGGHCYRLEGAEWVDCGEFGDNVNTLLAHDGALYAATHKRIFRYEGGQNWTCIGHEPHGTNQIHSSVTFGGRLHIGTWPQGYVLRLEPNGDWTNTGRLGISEGLRECNEVNDLTVHNGKLYAGVLPKAQVWRYESDGHWTLLNSLASRPDWDAANPPTWGRVTCMSAFRGELFAGTGACEARAVDRDPGDTMGRVLRCRIGLMAGYDRDIGLEWTHLAAVRQSGVLRLYVNGWPKACSTAPAGRAFDLSNTQPLLIGSGPQASFAGAISDVRLYAGALPEEQLQALGASAAVRV